MAGSWEDTFDDVRKKNMDIKRKMVIDNIREKVPAVEPELAFITPSEILEAMRENPVITSFHDRLLNEYQAPEKRYALLFPDADRKPWTEGTDSLIYRNLHTSIRNLKMEDDLHVFSISPVLGVVPMEWWDTMPMYDSSGGASYLVRRRGLTWSAEDFREVIQRAGEILNSFLKNNHGRFGSWHIIYREPSVHQRIFQSSNDIRPYPVWPQGTRKSLADSYLLMRGLIANIREG